MDIKRADSGKLRLQKKMNRRDRAFEKCNKEMVNCNLNLGFCGSRLMMQVELLQLFFSFIFNIFSRGCLYLYLYA